MTYLLLLAPSANRVYAGETARLARAELRLACPFATDVDVDDTAGLAGIGFGVDAPAGQLTADQLGSIARLSASLALFERVEPDLLRPVPLPRGDVLDDDLVTIPKYQGKTNEQFTRLLLNLTLSARELSAREGSASAGQLDVLDPLSGRGTTLETAWLFGHNAYGVEGDEKAVEAMSAYLKTWLRRKRLKHTAAMTPVRREGKSIGRRFDAEVRPADGPILRMGVFTGDTRDSAKLWGKKRFDAIVTDAPYGVVHGSHSDVRGVFGKRDRSAAGLLAHSLPVWAGQLKPGGALGVSWNTHGLAREDLVAMARDAGLEVLDDDLWRDFSHRVDSSIQRDLLVARKPLAGDATRATPTE